ncbi:MAG: DNA gyrase inhibitor YacG [Caulobacterales bacterium]
MTAGRCPICDKPIATQFRPFCSARCADIDLQRWLSGAYTVPAVEADDDGDDGQGGGQEDDADSTAH